MVAHRLPCLIALIFFSRHSNNSCNRFQSDSMFLVSPALPNIFTVSLTNCQHAFDFAVKSETFLMLMDRSKLKSRRMSKSAVFRARVTQVKTKHVS